jgi:D-lactate dehydrogenase
MNVAMYSSRSWDRAFFKEVNTQGSFEFTFLEPSLNPQTGRLAEGFEAVCLFVNDDGGKESLRVLAEGGVRYIALRSAGFNHVDLREAERLGMQVVRVPAYSPYAVAEHALALILALNRQVHRAYNRVREGNFSLQGLMGFELNRSTVGVVGTGRIGEVFCRLLEGFGCQVVAFDPYPNDRLKEKGIPYLALEQLLQRSDVVSLHCPLTPDTQHLINPNTVQMMKPGSMLINTSRGELIDTRAAIQGLKNGRLGYLGLDVYEEEGDLFFEDLSDYILQDDVFARLLTFPNVIITGHQAFFTRNAVRSIAETTLQNLEDLASDGRCVNLLTSEKVYAEKGK